MKKDIYFEEEYGKLYEDIEKGKLKVFKYKDENGEISNQFILREIPTKVGGQIYFDIVTPYGYGGPIIEKCVEGKKTDLIEAYMDNFQKYCNEEKIVSEFVRFHPLFDNAKTFGKYYNTEYIRHTLGTNLKDFEEPVKEEFSKSARSSIKQAINRGITYKITEAPKDISVFEEIYYATMDRNNATEYYYFGDKYFKEILKNFRKNILLIEAIYENKTIACGFYLIYDKIIHMHLFGTFSEYLHLSPSYIIKQAVTLWGKENGYDIIHLGGGKSNSADDSLYKFKKKFAQNTEFDFGIGKKIWNQEIYNELCKKKNIGNNEEFFPAYRKEND